MWEIEKTTPTRLHYMKYLLNARVSQEILFISKREGYAGFIKAELLTTRTPFLLVPHHTYKERIKNKHCLRIHSLFIFHFCKINKHLTYLQISNNTERNCCSPSQ